MTTYKIDFKLLSVACKALHGLINIPFFTWTPVTAMLKR